MSGLLVLETASLIYAALPTVLFLAGWLKPVFSVPLLICLGVGIYRACRVSPSSGPPADAPLIEETGRRIWVRYVCIALLVAFAVALSGIGGYSYQSPDYGKHNAFFRDLTEKPWPLGYEQTGTDGKPRVLNAYFGYYLPAAFVGKCLDWTTGYHFSYVWATLGVLLTVAWFLRLTGKVSVTVALAFLLFGGLDILGWTIANGWPDYPDCNGVLDYWMPRFIQTGGGRSAAMNTVFFTFVSNYTFLVDGPHHVLPSWICILMLVHDAIAKRSSQRAVLLWSLLPLVSAFVAVGTFPFVVVALWQTRLRKAFSLGNLVVAPLLLLVAGLYLRSNNGAFLHGWLWEFQDLRRTWLNLLLYYMVEFGLYVAVCPLLKQKENQRYHVWWYTAIGVLLLLPWYRIGGANDFTSKGAVAAILIFQVCLVVAVCMEWQAPTRRFIGALPVLLFLGTFASIGEMMRALDYGLEAKNFNMSSVEHINELEPKAEAAQLFSDGDTFFWRFLARRPQFQPSPPVPVIASWDFAGGKPGQSEWKCLVPNGRITPQGCAFELREGRPVLLLSGVHLATEDFSRIRIQISGTRKGDPQAKPVSPSSMFLCWARSSDITAGNRTWPFGTDRAISLKPGRNSELWEAKLAGLKAWKGEVCDVFLHLDGPRDFHDGCEFRISRIEFLER